MLWCHCWLRLLLLLLLLVPLLPILSALLFHFLLVQHPPVPCHNDRQILRHVSSVVLGRNLDRLELARSDHEPLADGARVLREQIWQTALVLHFDLMLQVGQNERAEECISIVGDGPLLDDAPQLELPRRREHLPLLHHLYTYISDINEIHEFAFWLVGALASSTFMFMCTHVCGTDERIHAASSGCLPLVVCRPLQPGLQDGHPHKESAHNHTVHPGELEHLGSHGSPDRCPLAAALVWSLMCATCVHVGVRCMIRGHKSRCCCSCR